MMNTKAQSAQASGTGEITRFLEEMREGEPKAADQLLSLVYRELRALAAGKMANEVPGQTLQPTALVHEAWLRVMGGYGQRFPSRAYFFAAAGEAKIHRFHEGNHNQPAQEWVWNSLIRTS